MSGSECYLPALRQASDAILITDADLKSPGPRILFANAAFSRLTGYSAEELIGQSPRLLQGPLTSRTVLDELVKTLQEGRSFRGNTTNYRKDGSPFELEWHVSPLRAADGTTTQYLSVHRDVTAVKQFHCTIDEYVGRLLEQQRQYMVRQTELEATNSKLQVLSTTDGLTGVFNHRHFHEQLGKISVQAKPISLLMVDVDHFKSFNDTFGHPVGDRVLQKVAEALRAGARKSDMVVRYGGEEFAVLMSDCEADPALALAERIRHRVASISIPERSITVSVGVSTIVGGNGVGRMLLEQADVALYAAKAAGRNRVMHHRHIQSSLANASRGPAGNIQCAPSSTGCLRCESAPSTQGTAYSVLLLGPQDADAGNMLRQALSANGFEFSTTGPLLIVPNVRDRLAEIETLFKSRLSPVTRASVSAAYMPGGLMNSDQIMSALLVARPLSELLHNFEHEWIREALSDGWLFSVFHPIIHARTGEVFAQEALLRARNPRTQKIVGAGQIIHACEKLKLQHQLDQRARQAAIQGASEHVPTNAKVFINFLPNTIYDPAICLRTTMEAAERCRLPMSRLVFEVVETEKIPDLNRLGHILDYYRERGVGTAIDDMGAGFSGIDYITSLKPDFVKLDREFVLAAEATTQGRKQMDRIISASHRQDASVIAEGIETEAQMAMCVEAGVNFLQGFLFAKPACPPQPVNFPATFKRVA
jgi:diguanylate cyclase (GGDEF)-like protein/PAS domain S-box-containing protein